METINNVQDGVMGLLQAFLSPDTLKFFGSLGTWGWIGIGAGLLLIGLGGFFLIRWVKKQANEKAARETEKERSKAETELPNEQSRLEKGVRSSLEKLREWLKK